MSARGSHLPPPPFVEDYDEAEEAPPTISPPTRFKKTFSARRFDDDVDSGYGSKAPSLASSSSQASSHYRRSEFRTELSGIVERERKPYQVPGVPPTKPLKSTISKDPYPSRKSKAPFCHQRGICWVCDKYGYHFNPRDLPTTKTPNLASQSPNLPGPRVSTPTLDVHDDSTGATSEEGFQEPRRRTSLSNINQRPTSMYAYPPTSYISHQQYSPELLQTPLYSTHQPQEPFVTHPHYMPPSQIVYDEARPQQLPENDDERNFAGPSARRSSTGPERPRQEKRPLITYATRDQPRNARQKSTKSIDVDRKAMPPPPKPSYVTVNANRPRIGRSNTYHPKYAERYSENEDDSDAEYITGPRTTAAYERPSVSRTPSSYRKEDVQEAADRSKIQQHSMVRRPRKATSYRQDSNTVQVASDRDTLRRSSESAPPSEKPSQSAEDEAEAYIRKRGSFPITALTAENLKTFKSVIYRQPRDHRANNDSADSKSAHDSLSKDIFDPRQMIDRSDDRTLDHAPPTRMNININGINVSIANSGNDEDGPPVEPDRGGVKLSMSNEKRRRKMKKQKDMETIPDPIVTTHDSATSHNQTIYSGDGSVRTLTGSAFSEEFIRLVLEDIGEPVTDPQMISRLCSDFEELLTNFAHRLQQESSSSVPPNVVTLFHRYKGSMHAAMKRALSSLPFGNTDEAPSINPIPFEERMQEWLGRGDNFDDEAPRSPKFELPDPLLEEAGEVSKDFERHKRLISDTASYRWLIDSLRNVLLLTEANPGVKRNIRDELFSRLPEPGENRTGGSTSRVGVSLSVFWDITMINFTTGTKGVGSILTVTGGICDAQILTCEEYIYQTWPSTGMYVLQLVNKIMSKPDELASVRRLDGTVMEAVRQGLRIEVKVFGVRDIILEVTEQLSWITAVLRSSPRSKALRLCSPSVCFLDDDPFAADSAATEVIDRHHFGSQATLQAQDLPPPYTTLNGSFHIGLTYKRITADVKPGFCWYNFFDCCTIIEGFPIQRRSESSLGLELALNVISWLVGTKYLQPFADSVFIKSFSTILRPVKKVDNILVWHLCFSDADDPISYLEDSILSPCKIDTDDLLESRHVVGWCSNVSNYCGAADGHYDAERSMISLSDSNSVLHGCDLLFGSLIVGGTDFTPTKNHTPALRVRRTLTDMFKYLERKSVLFWDTRDERGWLVNGLQAALHLIRQSIKIDRDEDTNGGVFVLKPEDLLEPQKPHDIESARTFLRNVHNLRAKVSLSSITGPHDQEYEVLADRLQQFCDVIEKAFNYQQRYKERTSVPRSRWEGWDLISLATKDDPVQPLMTTIPSVGKSWVDFVRGLGAITLFGEGFGELLKPETCGELPRNKFYMACAIPTIRHIMTQARCDQRSMPLMVSQSPPVMWYSPPQSLDHKCETESDSTHQDTDTQVLWPREHIGLLPGQSDKPDLDKLLKGAVIFGHNSNLTHYIPEFGPPVLGSPPASDQELELFEDSGLGSSISDKRTDTPSTATALSFRSPVTSPLALPEIQGQQYGNSSISGSGYTILGNVHGNITVQHYSSPKPD